MWNVAYLRAFLCAIPHNNAPLPASLVLRLTSIAGPSTIALEKEDGMTIRDLADKLGSRVLIGHDRLDQPVYSACCSDLMSDVLAFVTEKTVLLTGLTNMHVLRTAEILDLKCLIFARGKMPGPEMLERAQEMGLVVLCSPHTMFTSAGLLYEAGLRGALMPSGAAQQSAS